MCFVVCSKQYVLLSVLLCLLASGLVVFFLFPHSVLVDDDGIKVVKVTFNEQDSLVILAITVRLGPPFLGCAPVSLVPRTLTRVSSLALIAGHPENQELQLLLCGGEQPVQPGSVHEHRGWVIRDN